MRLVFMAMWGLLLGSAAGAHSASDAYLQLTAADSRATRILHGQWDIALRDLDFVLDLDAAGRGKLTWGEVLRHQPQIEAYAYRHLRFDAGNAGHCTVKPIKQMLDQHADGTYAVLLFDVTCVGRPPVITLDYDLFFGIDPSHRAILVWRSGTDLSSALLAPQNRKIDLH
jgi:hypothetical protein